MGILQAAYRTFESQSQLAGVSIFGKAPLTPVSHMLQNAHIEITIGDNGAFLDAKPIPKEDSKTLIPVTEESAGRTGDNERAHPLSDQLRYLAAWGADKYKAYLSQLTKWAESDYSHPKVRSVLLYIQGGTILSDLAASGLLTLDNQGNPAAGKVEATEYGKCLVRWRVVSARADESAACWEDCTLQRAFTAYYQTMLDSKERELCLISGSRDIVAESHPKGVIQAAFGAKLISANDDKGFTYRGRFSEAKQAGTVGYTASQKAHSALRWVAANHGVLIGGRIFLWWNPDGKALPGFDFLGMADESGAQATFVSYKRQLLETLGGYKLSMRAEDDVVVAALDAATTGRLSVTYYNELKANDFLDRLQCWYETCCWDSWFRGMYSPPLRQIVHCAFGIQRGNFIEADDRILREYVQSLLHCIIDRQPVPGDVVRALAARAGTPLAYSFNNRETLLATACAVIRKHRNDRQKKEEWTLALDENNKDRSYLYGRLLAVAERIERSTYSQDENREPNAIRMQAVFSQRPQYAWRILYEALEPYFKRLTPGLRGYYRNIIQTITDNWTPDTPDLNKKLEDVYLLGYYHQRAALTKKKDQNTVMEENENGSAE